MFRALVLSLVVSVSLSSIGWTKERCYEKTYFADVKLVGGYVPYVEPYDGMFTYRGGGPFYYSDGYEFAAYAVEDGTSVYGPGFSADDPLPVPLGRYVVGFCNSPMCPTTRRFEMILDEKPDGYMRLRNEDNVLVHARCPDGYNFSSDLRMRKRLYPDKPQCIRIVACETKPTAGIEPEKNYGAPETCAGNPINIGSANKFQAEIDYSAVTSGSASLTRYYNSQDDSASVLGVAWRHNYERHLQFGDSAIETVRADGKVYTFTQNAGQWESAPDVPDRLVEDGDGWEYLSADGTTEAYDENGLLREITDKAGRTQSLTYDGDGRLGRVTDAYGRALQFTYDGKGRLVALTDPVGAITAYHYSENRLSGVTYPDGSERNYLYENPDFPNALTGIVDAAGNRIASWSYDENGWAVSSAHAGGADDTQLAYHDDDSVTVTNALGKKTTYHFEVYHGVPKVVEVEGHATEHCAGANRSYTYNEDGFVISKTDWRGNTTTYVRNENGREISRTEAVGTPEERTVTTEWHSEFNKPVRIVGPEQVTAMRYDEQGRLLERTTTPR